MGFFHKKKELFLMPATGKLLPLEEIDDQVFSKKLLGDGFAIVVEDGCIQAPISGEITMAFPTGHAIGIKSKQGYEILIHIGMDTVELNGKGFTSHVTQGDYVTQGDKLVDVDCEYVLAQGKTLASPIIFTSGETIHINKPHSHVTVLEADAIRIHQKGE